MPRHAPQVQLYEQLRRSILPSPSRGRYWPDSPWRGLARHCEDRRHCMGKACWLLDGSGLTCHCTRRLPWTSCAIKAAGSTNPVHGRLDMGVAYRGGDSLFEPPRGCLWGRLLTKQAAKAKNDHYGIIHHRNEQCRKRILLLHPGYAAKIHDTGRSSLRSGLDC